MRSRLSTKIAFGDVQKICFRLLLHAAHCQEEAKADADAVEAEASTSASAKICSWHGVSIRWLAVAFSTLTGNGQSSIITGAPKTT